MGEAAADDISANALLSYMHMHPSGSWQVHPQDVWAPGNVHMVLRQEVAYEAITRMHSLCGMRTLSDHIMFHEVVGLVSVISREKSRVVVRK